MFRIKNLVILFLSWALLQLLARQLGSTGVSSLYKTGGARCAHQRWANADRSALKHHRREESVVGQSWDCLRLQRLSYLLSHIALTLLLKSETVSNIEQHKWTKSYHQHTTHTTSKAHSIPHTGRLGVNTFSDEQAFTCLNLHICKQARIQNNAWQKGRATTKWSRDTLLLRTDPSRNRELRKKRREHQREKTPTKEVTHQRGLR